MKFIHYTPLILVAMSVVGCTKGLEEKITSLETEKSTFQEKISTLEAEKSKLSDVKSGLNKQLEVAKEENKTLQDQVQQLTSQLTESKNKFKQADQSLKQAQGKLKESELELAKLQVKWEALEQEKERAAKQAASTARLECQFGIRMKSGDSKPVSATKFFLTKKNYKAIVGSSIVNQNNKTVDTMQFWSTSRGPLGAIGESAKIESKLENESIAVSSTDFTGKVVFKDIPKGIYYLMGTSPLGCKYKSTVWIKELNLKSGDNKFSYNQEDAVVEGF